MKITIDLEWGSRFGVPQERYTWKLKIPKNYATSNLATRGFDYDFDRALEEARRAVAEIYRFNEKKSKFPYVEDYTP